MSREPLRMVAVMEAATVTGPAKNLIEFCKTARREGSEDLPAIDPLVVTFVRGLRRNAFLDALDAAGIRSQAVRERFRFDPRALRGLGHAVRAHAPDVMQTHSVKSHFLVRLCGLDRSFPWIGFHHGYTSTDLKMGLYNRLDRWSLPQARRVVTVCRPFADQMIARGVQRDRITILHNSVRIPGPADLAEVEQIRVRLGVSGDEPVILCIGRFSKEKGHADLVDAIAEFRQRWQRPFRVVLAGDGPEQASLRERIHSLELDQNFVFAGHVGNVSPLYALASLMTLPSHSEGSPNVLLEAMAHGVPVVATTVGGVPEILRDGETGLLVPPRDSKALGRAIDALLADRTRARALADAARRRVEEFTPDAYRRRLLEVYLQVLGRRAMEPSVVADYPAR